MKLHLITYTFSISSILCSCVTNEISSKTEVLFHIIKSKEEMNNHVVRVYNEQGDLVEKKVIEELKGDTTISFVLFPANYHYSILTNNDSLQVIDGNYFSEAEAKKYIFSKYDNIYKSVEPIFYKKGQLSVDWEQDKQSIVSETPVIFSGLLEVRVINTQENIELKMTIDGVGSEIYNSSSNNPNSIGALPEEEYPSKIVFKNWVFPSVDDLKLNFYSSAQDVSKVTVPTRSYDLARKIKAGDHMIITIDDLTQTVLDISVSEWGEIEGGEVEPI